MAEGMEPREPAAWEHSAASSLSPEHAAIAEAVRLRFNLPKIEYRIREASGRTPDYCRGRASNGPRGPRVCLTWGSRVSDEDRLALLLHEIAHHAAGLHEWHSVKFYTLFWQLAHEYGVDSWAVFVRESGYRINAIETYWRVCGDDSTPEMPSDVARDTIRADQMRCRVLADGRVEVHYEGRPIGTLIPHPWRLRPGSLQPQHPRGGSGLRLSQKLWRIKGESHRYFRTRTDAVAALLGVDDSARRELTKGMLEFAELEALPFAPFTGRSSGP